MLQLTARQHIILALVPADFRKGIVSLAATCKAKLDEDPFSGTVFVFTNRKRTAIKALVFDGKRFCKTSIHGGTSISSFILLKMLFIIF